MLCVLSRVAASIGPAGAVGRLQAKRGEEVVVAGLTWAAWATGGGSDFSVEPRAPRA